MKKADRMHPSSCAEGILKVDGGEVCLVRCARVDDGQLRSV